MANTTAAAEHTARAVALAMERNGASINGLAATTGIAYSSLRRRLTTPDRYGFEMTELLIIAEALGVSPAEFIPPAFGVVA